MENPFEIILEKLNKIEEELAIINARLECKGQNLNLSFLKRFALRKHNVSLVNYFNQVIFLQQLNNFSSFDFLYPVDFMLITSRSSNDKFKFMTRDLSHSVDNNRFGFSSLHNPNQELFRVHYLLFAAHYLPPQDRNRN
jgi:hypothetical protein